MKTIIILIAFMAIKTLAVSQNEFYNFKVLAINGDTVSLSQFKGKKILVVNTASKCGFTKQYKDLQELFLKYKDQNFVIIGFPANNFLSQEPGSNAEINEFCSLNYGVTFPMMEKISVKGKDIHPLYLWLTSKDKNGVKDSKVEWNFQKFLIDENGQLVKSIAPNVNPMSEEIQNWIKGN